MDVVDVLAHWAHMMATVIWIGGMFFNLAVLRPAMSILDAPQRLKLTQELLGRFLVAAWVCVAILAVTGIEISGIESSGYEGALLAKHATVAFMITILTIISVFLFPRLKKLTWTETQAALRSSCQSSVNTEKQALVVMRTVLWLVRANLTLGILVLVFTAILEHA